MTDYTVGKQLNKIIQIFPNYKTSMTFYRCGRPKMEEGVKTNTMTPGVDQKVKSTLRQSQGILNKYADR